MFPLKSYKYEIPKGDNVGSYSFKRRMDVHTGCDLYSTKGAEVRAIEDGIIVGVENFTGSKANPPSDWWNDTEAILIEGKSGVILYGEIEAGYFIKVGEKVKEGDFLGRITPVLKKNKGVVPSINMLHIELYEHGTKESVVWNLDEERPSNLKDITPLLEKELAPQREMEQTARRIMDKVYEVTSTDEAITRLIKWLDFTNIHVKKLTEYIKNKTAMWGDNVDQETEELMTYDYLEDMDSFLLPSKEDRLRTKFDLGFWVNKPLFEELLSKKNPEDMVDNYGKYTNKMVLLYVPLDSDYFSCTIRAEIFLTEDLKDILYIGFNEN